MKKNKNIFKTGLEILEGIKNNIFKKEDVEAIAKDRWQICTECKSLDAVGTKCAVPGTKPCCGECGCSLGLMLRSLSSECPIGKWEAFLNEQEEDALNEKLEKED